MRQLLAAGLVVASAFTMGAPVQGWRLRDASEVLTADGAAISRVGFDTSGWRNATVPGTVLTSLVNDGLYPEPLYGENNRVIPDSLCRTDYWYRAEFRVPRLGRGRRAWLHFAGINYIADVWVNGHEVGQIRGAFARGDFDVTPYVESGQAAAVAVRITPPPHPSTPHEKTQATGTGRNGGAMGEDGPTFLATVGWDWMPAIRDRDIGIWQDVTFDTTGPVIIRDPYVVTTLPLPRTDSADLVVSATVRNASPEPQSGVLHGRIEGTGIGFDADVSLAPGESRLVKSLPMHMDHPKLWWPNTFGAQDRYDLKLTFSQGRTVSDASTTRFGVRSIRAFPAGGKDLTVIVNGVPVICKGGNWGMDEAMKRVPRSRLEAMLRLHHDANLTMIRNWIGMSTEEDFYDLCDEYGILVWDDFWIANPADGPNPRDAELFLANAKEKILRYRNHPSIAVWCGRNEGFPPKPIDDGLRELVAELDGQRFYQPHSAATNGVGGGGPYSYQPPQEYFHVRAGDAFHTEIGGPSIPTLEAIKAMMPKEDWWPINDDWAEHDLCRGAQRGDVYPQMLADRFGPVTGLADFVRKANLANYECYRGIFEGRFAHLFDPVTGVLLWMSSPAQPSFVWQLYSHDLEPTSALYGAQKACEPVHVELDQGTGRVFVVNSTPAGLSHVLVTATVYRLDGTKADEATATVDADADRATPALSLNLHSPAYGTVFFVKLMATGPAGSSSDNFYWLGQPGVENDYLPGDLQRLQEMPFVPLRLAATATGKETVRVTVRVQNPTTKIALMAHLQLRRASGARVLPAYYSDNYLNLLPGEVRTVTIEADRSALKGETPLVALDGWNVVLELPKPGTKGVPVELNADATVMTYVSRNLRASMPPAGTFRRIAPAGAELKAGWMSDERFVDGGFVRPAAKANVDLSGAGNKAAPEAVYRTPRLGDVTYRIPAPAGTYTLRLHFADMSAEEVGQHRFDVLIDGVVVQHDLDVFAEAGGRAKALVKEFAGIKPDANGEVTVSIRRGSAGFPFIDGLELLKGAG